MQGSARGSPCTRCGLRPQFCRTWGNLDFVSRQRTPRRAQEAAPLPRGARCWKGEGAWDLGRAGPPREPALTGWSRGAGTGECDRAAGAHLRGAERPSAGRMRTASGPGASGVRGGSGRRARGLPEEGGGAGGPREARGADPLAAGAASPPASTRSRRGSGMGAARALPAPTPV